MTSRTAPIAKLALLALLLLGILFVIPAASQGTDAGNGQTTASVSSGIDGQSTGSSINFQSGSTSAAPSMSVVQSSTTNSQASASLSSESVQEKGSDGAYSSTTGSAISGISDSLTGGFTAPSGAGTDVQGSVSNTGSGNGAFIMSVPLASTHFLDAFFVNGLLLTTMFLAGAIFVL